MDIYTNNTSLMVIIILCLINYAVLYKLLYREFFFLKFYFEKNENGHFKNVLFLFFENTFFRKKNEKMKN